MRLAMVIQGFHPHLGGAEHQLRQVAPRLRSRGVDVHIITRRMDPGWPARERIDGVPVHRIAMPGPKPVASAAFIAGAVSRIRQLRPDVIHAHELLSPATVALLAAAGTGRPVVAKVLVGGELAYLRDHRPFGPRRLEAIRNRVTTFVTISDQIDGELADLGVEPARRRCIPNGIDLDRFRHVGSASIRDRARRELGLGPGPTMLFAGRMAPQKNLGQLLTVFDELRRHHPTAQLLLAGEGSERAALEATAGDGVRFLGLVDDIATVLPAADVFVLPSWREGLSNALLEAMAGGLAVVATSVGGTVEVIDDSVNGLLVPPGDGAALSAAADRVLSSPELRARLGAAAARTVTERFDIEDTADALASLYQELVPSAAPDPSRSSS